jgi:hypothetical protein
MSKTQQLIDLQIYIDAVSLALIWSNPLRFPCPHCGADHEMKVGAADLEPLYSSLTGCPAFLLNIEKRSLPRLMLSGDGLASKDAV